MSFMWKKVKRLFILYLMASLIVVSIKLITQGEAYVEHPVTPTSYLEIFYLPAVGYYLWFVWALFLMFAVVHLFHNRRGHIILFTLWIVLYFLPSFHCRSMRGGNVRRAHTNGNAYSDKKFAKIEMGDRHLTPNR